MWIAYFFLVFCAVVAQIEGEECMNRGNSSIEKIFTYSNGLFSVRFYEAVNDNKENLLISPLSLNYALTALSMASIGETRSELMNALNQQHLLTKPVIAEAYHSFTNSLKVDTNLTIATKLFLDNNFPIEKNKVFENFEADIENVDFYNNPDESRIMINDYIENKTNHLIKEMLQPGSVNSETIFILANALYFKSEWLYPFNASKTKKDLFYGLENEYEIDMMFQTGLSLKYKENIEINAELLEIPYKGGYTFLIILPFEKDGITEVEEKIMSIPRDYYSSPFTDIFEDAASVLIELHLPKFKFEEKYNLRKPLEEMGIARMFTSSAEFPDLTREPVSVSDIIQSTYISVDEYETEAAAVTVTNLRRMGPQLFKVDHPFIYVIKNNILETPLFIGRYMKPSEAYDY